MKYIISFTSWEKRLPNIAEFYEINFKNLNTDKYKLCLTVWKEELKFIPPELQKLIDDNKIELIIAEENLKPHKKYYYVMKKYKEYPIIIIDDDIKYNIKAFDILTERYERDKCICGFSGELIDTEQPYGFWLKMPNIVMSNDKNHMYKEEAIKYNLIDKPRMDILMIGQGMVLYPPDCLKVDEIDMNEIHETLRMDDFFLMKRAQELNIPREIVRLKTGIYGKNWKAPGALYHEGDLVEYTTKYWHKISHMFTNFIYIKECRSKQIGNARNEGLIQGYMKACKLYGYKPYLKDEKDKTAIDDFFN